MESDSFPTVTVASSTSNSFLPAPGSTAPASEAAPSDPAETNAAAGEGGADGVEAAEVGDEDDGEEGEPSGLRAALREKLISLRTMPRPLRLITGVAIAQLIVSALLLALHNLPGPYITVGSVDHRLTHMPIITFVVCFAFFLLAWAFALAGGLRAYWPVRLLALAIFSYIALLPSADGFFATFRLWLLALLWAWGLAIWLLDWRSSAPPASPPHATGVGRVARVTRVADVVAARLTRWSAWERSGRGGPLPARTVGLALLWLAVYYGVELEQTLAAHENIFLFTGSITVQLQGMAFVLIPVLFLAGSDFAELGEVIATSGAALLRVERWRWALAGATALLAALVLVYEAPRSDTVANWLLTMLGAVLMGAAAACVVWAAMRWLPLSSGGASSLPMWALVMVTALYFAGIYLPIFGAISPVQVTLADYSVYQHAAPPTFSMAYPADWGVSPLPNSGPNGVTGVIFNGVRSVSTGAFTLLTFPQAQDQQAVANALLQTVASRTAITGTVVRYGPMTPLGPWTSQRDVIVNAKSGAPVFDSVGWSRVIGDRIWLLYGFTPVASAATVLPAYAQMEASWRSDLKASAPNIAAPAAVTVSARESLISTLTPVTLALLIGVALLWRARRRRRVTLSVAGVFAICFALFLLGATLPQTLSLLGLPQRATWFLGLSLPALRLDAALATLIIVGALLARRSLLTARSQGLLGALFAFNVGLLLVSAMGSLYDWAIVASLHSTHNPFGVIEALVVLVALGWDVAMSGEQITNVDGRRFPRSVRLLLYMGYIMFVATLALFFASQTYAYVQATVDSSFESESYPRSGLFTLGVPLVAAGFALALARWRRGRGDDDTGAPAPPESAPPPAEQTAVEATPD